MEWHFHHFPIRLFILLVVSFFPCDAVGTPPLRELKEVQKSRSNSSNSGNRGGYQTPQGSHTRSASNSSAGPPASPRAVSQDIRPATIPENRRLHLTAGGSPIPIEQRQSSAPQSQHDGSAALERAARPASEARSNLRGRDRGSGDILSMMSHEQMQLELGRSLSPSPARERPSARTTGSQAALKPEKPAKLGYAPSGQSSSSEGGSKKGSYASVSRDSGSHGRIPADHEEMKNLSGDQLWQKLKPDRHRLTHSVSAPNELSMAPSMSRAGLTGRRTTPISHSSRNSSNASMGHDSGYESSRERGHPQTDTVVFRSAVGGDTSRSVSQREKAEYSPPSRARGASGQRSRGPPAPSNQSTSHLSQATGHESQSVRRSKSRKGESTADLQRASRDTHTEEPPPSSGRRQRDSRSSARPSDPKKDPVQKPKGSPISSPEDREPAQFRRNRDRSNLRSYMGDSRHKAEQHTEPSAKEPLSSPASAYKQKKSPKPNLASHPSSLLHQLSPESSDLRKWRDEAQAPDFAKGDTRTEYHALTTVETMRDREQQRGTRTRRSSRNTSHAGGHRRSSDRRQESHTTSSPPSPPSDHNKSEPEQLALTHRNKKRLDDRSGEEGKTQQDRIHHWITTDPRLGALSSTPRGNPITVETSSGQNLLLANQGLENAGPRYSKDSQRSARRGHGSRGPGAADTTTEKRRSDERRTSLDAQQPQEQRRRSLDNPKRRSADSAGPLPLGLLPPDPEQPATPMEIDRPPTSSPAQMAREKSLGGDSALAHMSTLYLSGASPKASREGSHSAANVTVGDSIPPVTKSDAGMYFGSME